MLLKMLSVSEIYSQAGIEKWEFPRRSSIHKGLRHGVIEKDFSERLYASPEFMKLMRPAYEELAALGFTKIACISCELDCICIILDSEVIAQDHAMIITRNNTIAPIVMLDSLTSVHLDVFAISRPDYMNKLAELTAARQQRIDCVNILLPQPIAEEIALYVSLDVSFHET